MLHFGKRQVMQGFILRTQPVRDEDLLVSILTQNELVLAYRFYGARHASITQGYKIDFELAQKAGFLPHLKGTLHLGYKWLYERERLAVWQIFMRLMYAHLKDASQLESFYFEICQDCCEKLNRQNPKRVVLEAYIRILEFEGRLGSDLLCFLCSKACDDELCLVRGFLCAHKLCHQGASFKKADISELFASKTSAHLSDEIVSKLYYIMLEGF